jgi:dynein heavy chain
MWQALYVKAISRSLKLESTKAVYAKTTVEEIDEFLKTIEDFVRRFEEEGPGAVGEDLDSGLILMDVRHCFRFTKQKLLCLRIQIY